MSNQIFLSSSEEKTLKHGRDFAEKIKKLPHLVMLNGPVGSGKTTWIKGFVSEYLKGKALVTSPTYSLIQSYTDGKKEVVHGDFYRLQSLDDLESVGFWDLLTKKRIILVEWGTLIEPHSWPQEIKVDVINFEIISESERKISTRFFDGSR